MIKKRRTGVLVLTIFLLICVIVMMALYIIYSAQADAKSDRCARDYRLYSIASSLAGISDAYAKSEDGVTDEIVRIYSNADNIIRQVTETDMESETRECIISDMNLIKSACKDRLADNTEKDVLSAIPDSAERLRFFNDEVSTTATAIYARLVETYDCDCIKPDSTSSAVSHVKTSGTVPSDQNDCEKSAAYFSEALLPMKCAKTALRRPCYVFYCENAYVTVDISGAVVRQYYYEGKSTSGCTGECSKYALETVRSLIPSSSGIGGGKLEVKSSDCDGRRCRVQVSQVGAPMKFATVEMCCDTKRVFFFDIGTLGE